MTETQLDGIFLDLYGTLTSGDRDAVESVCERIVQDAGLTMSAHALSVRWGERFLNSLHHCCDDSFETLYDLEVRTLRDTMGELGAAVDEARYADALREYWQSAPIHDDAIHFLQQCPVPVCIVSNADHADALAVVGRLGLPVEHVVTSEQTRSYKPDSRIFKQALAATGWRAECVLHCGDSLHSDIGGALASGIRAVWLNRVGRIHDIGTHDPHHTIDDLLGLLPLLERFVPAASPARAMRIS